VLWSVVEVRGWGEGKEHTFDTMGTGYFNFDFHFEPIGNEGIDRSQKDEHSRGRIGSSHVQFEPVCYLVIEFQQQLIRGYLKTGLGCIAVVMLGRVCGSAHLFFVGCGGCGCGIGGGYLL